MTEPSRHLEDGQQGGGCVNSVRRQGDSVIRPTGPWSPAIHQLLRHLESEGFEYSPRLLSVDKENNTERLTYIKGQVAMRPWPHDLCTNAGIAQIGSMLRAYHDSVSTFRPTPETRWRVPDAAWQEGMIVRHGDLGPWNMVWDAGRLIGVIDWDFAEPGRPVDDVAQAAWYCVPLRPEARSSETGINVNDQTDRFACLCDAYRIASEHVLTSLVALQAQERDRIQVFGNLGIEPWAAFKARGDVEAMTEDIRWLEAMMT